MRVAFVYSAENGKNALLWKAPASEISSRVDVDACCVSDPFSSGVLAISLIGR